MFKVPADIEKDLQKKYPQIHVPTFIDDVFQRIINKVITDGCSTIREFGKFVAFVTHSKRTCRDTVRFKFKISSSLNTKIKDDEYLLQNLPVKAKVVFNHKNEAICESKQEQKQENLKASTEAIRLGRKKTQEYLAKDIISNIINK